MVISVVSRRMQDYCYCPAFELIELFELLALRICVDPSAMEIGITVSYPNKNSLNRQSARTGRREYLRHKADIARPALVIEFVCAPEPHVALGILSITLSYSYCAHGSRFHPSVG